MFTVSISRFCHHLTLSYAHCSKWKVELKFGSVTCMKFLKNDLRYFKSMACIRMSEGGILPFIHFVCYYLHVIECTHDNLKLQSFILNKAEWFLWYIIYNAIRQPIVIIKVTCSTRHVSIKCQATIPSM